MTKGAACLSESCSLEKGRCVQTKAPLSKDHLRKFLSGLINRYHDLSNAPGEIKSYLGVFFRGERKVSFRLIEILYTILSGDIPKIPSENGLKNLRRGWKIYTEEYEVDPVPVFEKFFQSVDYVPQNADFWEYLYKLFKEEKPPIFEKAISRLIPLSRQEYAYLFDYSFRGYLDFREFAITGNRDLADFCGALNHHRDLSNADKLELIFHKFGKYQWQSGLDKHEVKGIVELSGIYPEDKVGVIKGYLTNIADFTVKQKRILNEHLQFWIKNSVIFERKEASKEFIEKLFKEVGGAEATRIVCNLEEGKIKEIEKLLDYMLFISEFYPDISAMDLGDLYRNLVFYLKNREYAVRSFETIDILIDNAGYSFSHFAFELLGHLFFKYEVPWLLVSRLKEIPHGYELLEWVIRYNKLKDFENLPIRITKKETHVFFTMYSKNQARVILERSENIIHAGLILAKIQNIFDDSYLIENLSNHYVDVLIQHKPKFWEDLARFFKRYERQIERGEVRNLLDYILAKKNENPDYTLNGSTYNSLNKEMHEWHEQMRRMRYLDFHGLALNTSWKGAPVQNDTIDKEGIAYHFYQITNQKELFEEGSSMHHCVSTYGKECLKGVASIWSLRIYNQTGMHRLLTIEVKNKKIVQAKGKHNRMPKEKEAQVLRLWAGKHGFKMRSY